MREAMAGADGVYHVAGWYEVGTRDKRAAVPVNVDGTRNVLELMRELAIPKGVYTSTLAIYSDTHGRIVDETYHEQGAFNSVYERTKWQAHFEVAQPMMADGLPLVIAQPGVVYGPGDHSTIRTAFVQYLRGILPLVPREVAFCWSYVDDCARGIMLAMERGKPGETYIIGGPPHTLLEAFKLARQITGRPLPLLRPGSGMMRFMAGFMGVVEKVIPLPPTFTREALLSSAGTYLGSSAKAERELGWQARSLAEGLPSALEYEMAQLGIKPR